MLKKTDPEIAREVRNKYLEEVKNLQGKGDLTPEKRPSLWGNITAALWGEVTPADEQWGNKKVQQNYADKDEAEEAREEKEERFWEGQYHASKTDKAGSNGFWILVFGLGTFLIFLAYHWFMTLSELERVGFLGFVIFVIWVAMTNGRASEEEEEFRE